jgi:hypothetical protein
MPHFVSLPLSHWIWTLVSFTPRQTCGSDIASIMVYFVQRTFSSSQFYMPYYCCLHNFVKNFTWKEFWKLNRQFPNRTTSGPSIKFFRWHLENAITVPSYSHIAQRRSRKIILEVDAKNPSISSAMNRPCSGLNISSDLFYINQSGFPHSRAGIAIVFTSDGIPVSHTSPLPPLSSLTCLFNADICKCLRNSVISWPKLNRENTVLRMATKKVTPPNLWGTSSGPPFFPEWPVEPLLTYDIITINGVMQRPHL